MLQTARIVFKHQGRLKISTVALKTREFQKGHSLLSAPCSTWGFNSTAGFIFSLPEHPRVWPQVLPAVQHWGLQNWGEFLLLLLTLDINELQQLQNRDICVLNGSAAMERPCCSSLPVFAPDKGSPERSSGLSHEGISCSSHLRQPRAWVERHSGPGSVTVWQCGPHYSLGSSFSCCPHPKMGIRSWQLHILSNYNPLHSLCPSCQQHFTVLFLHTHFVEYRWFSELTVKP